MIVNADDFGLGSAENRAIVAAFERGLVSSATVLANMPGFEEACELAARHGLASHVGVHLVLTDGEPLTEAMRRSTRFCDADGRFVRWAGRRRVLRLDRAERETVAAELAAQVDACRRRGLPVTHLDSHHHVHFEPGVLLVALRVARTFGVQAVRTLWNAGAMSARHRAWAALANAELARRGLRRTRYAGDVETWTQLHAAGARPALLDDFELATHPRLGDGGELLDSYPEPRPLAEVLAPLGAFERVSYAGARYAGALTGPRPAPAPPSEPRR